MSNDSIVLRELSNAQAYAKSDPPAALSKIRFVAEALTDIVATRAGAARQPTDTQETFLRRLEQDGVIASSMARRLHDLRIIGNKGVHEMSGTSEEAFNAIASARLLTDEVFGIRAAAPSGVAPRRRETVQSSVADRVKLMGGNARRPAPDSGIEPLPLGWRDLFALAPGRSGIVLFFVGLALALAALFVAAAAPIGFVRELVRARAGAIAGNLAGTATFVAELMVLGWVVSAKGTARLWRAAIAPLSFAAGIFAFWLLVLAMTEIAAGLGEQEAAPTAPIPASAPAEHVATPEAIEPNPATPLPSFSCTDTLSYVEQQVCASPTLAELDQQLAGAYQEHLAMRSGADREALVSEQRSWLSERAACGDAICIEGAYRHRLQVLSGTQPEAPPVRQQSMELIEQPKWIGHPGSDFISTYYPPQAFRLGIEGTAVITCLVTEKGELHTCEVLSEAPQGYGFGDAALGLASFFMLNPYDLTGRPVGGRSIQVPIVFKQPADRP